MTFPNLTAVIDKEVDAALNHSRATNTGSHLVFPFVCHTASTASRFGDCLSRYFQAMATALEAGATFRALPIAVDGYNHTNISSSVYSFASGAFFESLLLPAGGAGHRGGGSGGGAGRPKTPSASALAGIFQTVEKRFPLRKADAPWSRHIHFIRQVLSLAMNYYKMYAYPETEDGQLTEVFLVQDVDGTKRLVPTVDSLAAEAVIYLHCDKIIATVVSDSKNTNKNKNNP